MSVITPVLTTDAIHYTYTLDFCTFLLAVVGGLSKNCPIWCLAWIYKCCTRSCFIACKFFLRQFFPALVTIIKQESYKVPTDFFHPKGKGLWDHRKTVTREILLESKHLRWKLQVQYSVQRESKGGLTLTDKRLPTLRYIWGSKYPKTVQPLLPTPKNKKNQIHEIAKPTDHKNRLGAKRHYEKFFPTTTVNTGLYVRRRCSRLSYSLPVYLGVQSGMKNAARLTREGKENKSWNDGKHVFYYRGL